MAYSYTVTTKSASADGEQFITVVETDNAASDEFEITVPTSGRIIRWKAHSDNNSTTITPKIGEATNPAGISVVMEFASAAVTQDESSVVSPVYYASGGKLYGRSVVGGTVTTVTHYIYIRPTWGR